jgi:hypothetical protein
VIHKFDGGRNGCYAEERHYNVNRHGDGGMPRVAWTA